MTYSYLKLEAPQVWWYPNLDQLRRPPNLGSNKRHPKFGGILIWLLTLGGTFLVVFYPDLSRVRGS